MILSDSAILDAIDKEEIVITPFDRECLGSNSYDVHLSRHIACYAHDQLDVSKENEVLHMSIGRGGLVILPGRVFLGSTVEYTESHKHVPFLDGKSSVGRLGLFIHATAGRGDVGFKNHWTLELVATQPIKIFAGMKIGQLFFYRTEGDVLTSYDKKRDAKYNKRDEKPQKSEMHKNFERR